MYSPGCTSTIRSISSSGSDRTEARAQEIVDTRDGFDSGEPATRNDKGQQRGRSAARIPYQLLRDARSTIAQLNRVASDFIVSACSATPGRLKKFVTNQSKNQMVVFQLMRCRSNPCETVTLFAISICHVTTEKVHVTDHLAEGLTMFVNRVARRDFVQHRCEQKKVLAIDHRDFELRIATLLNSSAA